MVASKKLRHELDRVGEEMEALGDDIYRAEADLRFVREVGGLLRALPVYLFLLDLRRQRQRLKVRRNMLLNCLDQVRRDEVRRGERRPTVGNPANG